mmetsp:Transcript_3692/g.7899  ORF Transcript_3692/g.7899 Transcript_3692/m.7899 type:complete len:639 (-) Transcript_3692:13-1929(-)
MKFGNWFSENRLDFWLQHYLRYKFAKQLLLPLSLTTQLSLEHSISSFFDVLTEDLGKVESFYCKMERMQREKWAQAMDRLQHGNKSNRAMQMLQETCEGIYMALSNLNSFALVNYRGFMHLIEKERERLKHYGKGHPEMEKFEEILHQAEFAGRYVDKQLVNSCTRLMKDFQNQFAFHFFEGDIESAKKCLQSLTPGKQFTRFDTFMLGLFTGLGVMTAIVLGIICYEAGLDVDENKQFSVVFPLFRGAITFSLYTLLIGWNIYVWNHYSIDYKHLMKFRMNIPPAIRFLAQGVMLTVIFLISFGLYIVLQADLILNFFLPDVCVPLLSWIFLTLWLVMPLQGWCRYSGRTFIAQILLASFISPFSKVEFRHVFVIDQLVSMVIPLVDLEYSICYYTNFTSVGNCANKLRFAPLCIMIFPFVIRTMQCLRLVWESGSILHPQTINAGKYFSSVVVILANYCYKYYGGFWIYVWIVCAFLSTCYSICWDLVKDWGLIEDSAFHFGLRRKLIYKKPYIYYTVIGLNLLLRLTWTLTISPSVVFAMIRPELFTMLLGIGEVYRRIQWNFVRMEWEQLSVTKKEGCLSMLQTQRTLAKPLLSQMTMSTGDNSASNLDATIDYYRSVLRSLEARRALSNGKQK